MKKRFIKDSSSDKVMYAVTNTIMILILIVIAFPLIFVVSSSFSDPASVSAGRVILWPVGFSIDGYKAVFTHKLVMTGYKNTIIYTILGTFISVNVTMIAAYVLSRKEMPFRNFFMGIFVFTMFFSGGLIPTYILMAQIRFINNIWAMIIPGALNVYNMILARTFIMSSIPNEIFESSKIDGCNDIQYYLKMVLPLSKAIIAVITLYCVVGHWNSYFDALIYLNDREKFPLQLVLRSILTSTNVSYSEFTDPELLAKQQGMVDLMKYSLIIVSSLPVIIFYPFIQKYFVKGVMIGSVKG